VLYGVEPWWFYIANGVLNFNIIFIFAALSFPVLILSRRFKAFVFTSGGLLWIGALSFLPHKEERFLYPIYPIICLSGGLGVYLFAQISQSIVKNMESKKVVSSLFIWVVMLSAATLSISRTIALHNNYHAPLDVWQYLHDVEFMNGDIRQMQYSIKGSAVQVCVGKEWYRAPGHFFLPLPDHKFKLDFIKSSFDGLLPGHFSAPLPDGTRAIPANMNDRNKEVFDRYVNVTQCHYIVDLDFPDQSEPHYVEDKDKWEIAFVMPFLDSKRSPNRWLRAFWIPILSDQYNVKSQYYLLRNRDLVVKKQK